MWSLWAKFKKWLSKEDPEGMTNYDGVVCVCLPLLLFVSLLTFVRCNKDNNQTTTSPEKILIIRESGVSSSGADVTSTESTTDTSTGR